MRDAVEELMSSDQIAEAQALAARLNKLSGFRSTVWERLSPSVRRLLTRLEADFLQLEDR